MKRSSPPARVAKLRAPKHRYPDVWYEGLAYYEGGRTVATVAVLKLPIVRVSLGYLSNDPSMNSRFELDLKGKNSITATPMRIATALLTPQFAARHAPRYDELRRLHRLHRHLPSFESGYREPMRDARKAFAHIYDQMRMADSTARLWFKRDALEPIATFCDANLRIITAIADFLYAQKEATGEQLQSLLRDLGPVDTTPLRL